MHPLALIVKIEEYAHHDQLKHVVKNHPRSSIVKVSADTKLYLISTQNIETMQAAIMQGVGVASAPYTGFVRVKGTKRVAFINGHLYNFSLRSKPSMLDMKRLMKQAIDNAQVKHYDLLTYDHMDYYCAELV